jgi:hypothetical protein
MRHHQLTWVALAATMICSSPSFAKDWYVSSTDTAASDSNFGTSAAAPFKTLGKLLQLGKLASGDTINLACGSLWRETLALTDANSAGKLTIRNYEPNTQTSCTYFAPVISGGAVLNNILWQPVSGKIYYSYKLTANELAQIGNGPDLVFDPNSGRTFVKARYPNQASSGNNYAIATGVNQTTKQLTVTPADAQAIGSNDLSNADVHMRNELWFVTSQVATGFSAGALTVDAMPKSMSANDGYVLENKLWMLDAPSEWYFDKASGTLYMASSAGAGTPPPTQLEMVVRDNAVTIKNVPNIHIQGLTLRATRKQALDIRNSPSPEITDSNVFYAATGSAGECGDNAAIFVGPTLDVNNNCAPTAGAIGSHNAKIESVGFNLNGNAALSVMSDQATINKNFIFNTGLAPRTRNALAAVQVQAPGGTISANTIMNSAYMGLSFSNRSKSFNGVAKSETISGNAISGICKRYADCAGIYTYNGLPDGTGPTLQAQGGAMITGNVVYDIVGDYQGNHKTDRHIASGVYLDAYTKDVLVDSNVIYRVGTGIFVNAGLNNTVSNNWVHAATGQGLLATDSASGGALAYNKIKNNLFHTFRRYTLPAGAPAGTLPKLEAGVAQSWFHPTNPGLLFSAQGQANVVSGNIALDAGGKTTQWRLTQFAWPPAQDISASAWSQYAPTDTIKSLVRPRLTNVSGTNLVTNGDFSSNQLYPWSLNASDAGLSAITSVRGTCFGPCLSFLQNSGDPVQSNSFGINATGGLYYFEIMAVGLPGSKAEAHIFDSASVDTLGYSANDDMSHELGGSNGTYEMRWTERFFKPAISNSAARFAVYANKGKQVFIDQVKVFQVPSLTPGNLYDPTQYTSLINNTGTTDVNYQCPFTAGCDSVLDQAGASVTFPLTLSPGARKMVFRVDPNWTR